MSGRNIGRKPVNALKKPAVLVLIFLFILTGCNSARESGGIEESENAAASVTVRDTEKDSVKKTTESEQATEGTQSETETPHQETSPETTEPVTTTGEARPETEMTTGQTEPSVPHTDPPVQQTEPPAEPPVQDQPQMNGTPFGSHGRLSVSGTRLTDQYGAGYTLRGISTHGLSWFPEYVNYDMFKQMRDEWNVNVVRLAMYTAEYNGYCTGDMYNREKLKKLIDDGVNYANQLGIYVIIDWHILSDGNPNMYKNESIEFFREISAKYAEYGNVIYEICNEPNGGTGWGEIKSYAQDVINVIRSNDSSGIVIVGTPTWSQDADIAADDRLNGENIMYAMHFYADTHRDHIRDKLVNAINKGLPVIVSEFGICDASGNGGINYDEASKWMSLLNQYSVSYVLWNLSNKSETSAMIQSWCVKSAGFSYEELSESGKWFVNLNK